MYIREVFCQQVVTALANFCHAYGKVLPTRWQSLANGKAKPCQQGGKKKTLFLWQKETSPYIRLPKKERIP
ncbi:hypothetical protein F3B47_24030 [Bacteroides fragilis]|nr:hypothetical protein F3B47_24030 [Bacteroides fragilis]